MIHKSNWPWNREHHDDESNQEEPKDGVVPLLKIGDFFSFDVSDGNKDNRYDHHGAVLHDKKAVVWKFYFWRSF